MAWARPFELSDACGTRAPTRAHPFTCFRTCVPQIKIIRDHINLVLTNVTEDVESHNEIVSRDPEIDKLFELEVKYPNKVAYC